MHRAGATEPTAEVINEVLLDIQQYLERCGFALSDFHLPAPDPALIQKRGLREIREKTDYDIGALQEVLRDNLEKLNEDQQMVFQAVMASVRTAVAISLAWMLLEALARPFCCPQCWPPCEVYTK